MRDVILIIQERPDIQTLKVTHKENGVDLALVVPSKNLEKISTERMNLVNHL